MLLMVSTLIDKHYGGLTSTGMMLVLDLIEIRQLGENLLRQTAEKT
jgi:hypothetical protein